LARSRPPALRGGRQQSCVVRHDLAPDQASEQLDVGQRLTSFEVGCELACEPGGDLRRVRLCGRLDGASGLLSVSDLL